MKRVFFTMAFIFSAMLLVCGMSVPADAYVTGVCSNCHTMHYSQNGTTPSSASGGPNGHLTLSTCLGCHGQGGDGSSNGVGGAPNIFASTTGNMRAGGTFSTAVAASKSKRHDVTDISGFSAGDDSYPDGNTPGNSGGGSGLNVGPTELKCAGAKGCHGDHTKTAGSDAGIGGFHHNKSNTAFRYLQTGTAAATNGSAVSGKGSSTWEYNGGSGPAAADHNVYSSDGTAGISKLCASCHGTFHGAANTYSGGAWIRHPTDTGLTALSGGVTSISVNYSLTPFGYADISGLTTTQALTTTDAQVVCVSCHRAHGSANDDLLRFSYSTQAAGSGGTTGCLNCHVAQR